MPNNILFLHLYHCLCGFMWEVMDNLPNGPSKCPSCDTVVEQHRRVVSYLKYPLNEQFIWLILNVHNNYSISKDRTTRSYHSRTKNRQRCPIRGNIKGKIYYFFFPIRWKQKQQFRCIIIIVTRKNPFTLWLRINKIECFNENRRVFNFILLSNTIFVPSTYTGIYIWVMSLKFLFPESS